jgi:hypothetical protein
MTALEDVQVQRSGVVALIYNVGTKSVDYELLRNSPKLMESLPFRVVSVHYCYSDVRIRPAMALIQANIGTEGRVRFRAHFGA